MAKYKVIKKTIGYVEADSKEDAEQIFDDFLDNNENHEGVLVDEGIDDSWEAIGQGVDKK